MNKYILALTLTLSAGCGADLPEYIEPDSRIVFFEPEAFDGRCNALLLWWEDRFGTVIQAGSMSTAGIGGVRLGFYEVGRPYRLPVDVPHESDFGPTHLHVHCLNNDGRLGEWDLFEII